MGLLKKTVFVSFFSVIFLHSAHLESGAEIERYYAGIGAQFFTFGRDTLAWGTSGLEYDNRDGKFTGLAVFSQLLKNGPAENAGIQVDDILLEIDGQKISVIGQENITKTLLRGEIGGSVLVQ